MPLDLIPIMPVPLMAVARLNLIINNSFSRANNQLPHLRPAGGVHKPNCLHVRQIICQPFQFLQYGRFHFLIPIIGRTIGVPIANGMKQLRSLLRTLYQRDVSNMNVIKLTGDKSCLCIITIGFGRNGHILDRTSQTDIHFSKQRVHRSYIPRYIRININPLLIHTIEPWLCIMGISC
ncbi:hypothetical protein D3C76_1179340 [compost metagenome]